MRRVQAPGLEPNAGEGEKTLPWGLSYPTDLGTGEKNAVTWLETGQMAFKHRHPL